MFGSYSGVGSYACCAHGDEGAIIVPDPPAITLLTPSSAHISDVPFTLVVTGTDFTAMSVIRIDGVVRATTFIDDTELRCSVDPAAFTAASHTVRVHDATSGQSNTAPLSIDHADPTLASVTPSSAAAGAGAQAVTLVGTGFDPASLVLYDGVPIVSVTTDTTHIAATIPSGAVLIPGAAGIVVENPTPGGGVSEERTFDVDFPTPGFTSLSVAGVLVGAGDTSTRATGTGIYAGATGAEVDGDPVLVNDVDSTHLDLLIPEAVTDVAGVKVVTLVNPPPGGGSSSSVNFTVSHAPPVITGLSVPSVAAGSGDTTTQAEGTGIYAVTAAKVDGAGVGETFQDGTHIDVVVPSAVVAVPGTKEITLENPGPGGGVSAPFDFDVEYPDPTLASLSVTSAAAGSGDAATQGTGTGFYAAGTKAQVDGADVPGSRVDATHFDVTIPSAVVAVPGTKLVTIVNPSPGGGTSETRAFDANYPAPTAGSATPSSALVGSGDTVVAVAGTGIYAGTIAKVGGANVTESYVSPTQIDVTIPASILAVHGAKNITLENPTPGGGASSAVVFNASNPVPTLTALSQTTHYRFEGDLTGVVLTGTNFNSTTTAAFVTPTTWGGGWSTALTITARTGTTLTVTIPEALLYYDGPCSITVTNPGPGGGTTAGRTFTVLQPTACMSYHRVGVGRLMDGTQIQALADQSGLGDANRNAAQPGATTLKPTYVAASANYNNRETCTFDGGDWLFTGTWASPVPAKPLRYYVVGHAPAAATQYITDGLATSGQMGIFRVAGGQASLYAGTLQNVSGGLATAGVSACHFDGVNSKYARNAKTMVATAGTTGTHIMIGCVIGGSAPSATGGSKLTTGGEFAERFQVDNTWTDPQHVRYCNFVNSWYGVPMAA